MQTRGRRYTGGPAGEEVTPELKALAGIEIYTRALIDEVNVELKILESRYPLDPKGVKERIELIARKGAYKDILQYIKESRDR